MTRPDLPTGNGTRVLSGARAIFMFNNEPIAFASGVTASEEIMYEPVETLDHLEVREHVPVGYRVTLSCQAFRTVAPAGAPSTNDSPGSLKQQNIFPRFESILRIQGVTAILSDRVSGKVLQMYENVKTASNNFSVSARSIVQQNVNFVTTRAYDEGDELPTATP